MFDRKSKPAGPRSWGFVWVISAVLLIISVNGALAERPVLKPDEIASAETHMWQAYYAGDLPKLHKELVTILRSQFRISSEDAESITNNLVFAAMRFEISRSNYEQAVLPDLEEAYRKLKAVLKRPFDPRRAARAELAWWVARRTPGQNSPQQVGKRIAGLYAIIYGAERPQLLEAGVLRAEAARLRDLGGANCDWVEVERLLRQSYRVLAETVQ